MASERRGKISLKQPSSVIANRQDNYFQSPQSHSLAPERKKGIETITSGGETESSMLVSS